MSSKSNHLLAGVVLAMLGVVCGSATTHYAALAEEHRQEQDRQDLAALEEEEIIRALETAGLADIVVGQDSEHERAQCLLNNGEYRAFTARLAPGEQSVLGNVCVTRPQPSTEST